MRIRRLVLQNYRRHRDTAIELPDGLISLVGRNGSGKSSLLEAIAFALYGTSATRTHKELLRSEHAPPADGVRVEMEAEVDGQSWRVVRELRGKNLSAVASLEVGGHVVVAPQAGSSDAVTREVAGRIGLSRDAFFTTVFSEQKQLGRLAQQKPADRKRLILSMMGVDALDRAIQEARRHRHDAQVRVETLQRELPDLQLLRAAAAEAARVQAQATAEVEQAETSWRAAQAGWKQQHEALEEARAAHEARREAEQAQRSSLAACEHAAAMAKQLGQRVEHAGQAMAQAQALADAPARLAAARAALEAALEQASHHARAEDLDGQIARLQEEAAALQVPGPNGMLEEAREAVGVLRQRREKTGAALAVASAQARQVRDRLRRVAGLDAAADCPVCERPLQDHLPDLHARFEEELAAHEAELEAGQSENRAVETALQEAEERLRETEAQAQRHAHAVAARKRVDAELERLLQQRGSLPDAAPDLAPLRQAVAEAEGRDQQRVRLAVLAEGLDDLQAQHGRACAALQEAEAEAARAQEALQGMPDTGPRLAAAQEVCEQALQAERSAERHLQERRTAAAEAAARCQAAGARLEEARQQRQRLREAQVDLEHWELLGGARGAGLLDRFRSHLVGRIGPAVSGEASRLLASFTGGRYSELVLDDDYQIYVGDGGVLYDVSRFSGGETDLVHLALRLAVSRLLLERAGVEIRLLCLDEVFGSLDDERRLLVLAALQELGGLYSQVFVVSHHDALREALDHAIVVEEQDGEAHIRMHNG